VVSGNAGDVDMLWSRKRTFNRPPAPSTVAELALWHSNVFSPFSEAHSFSIVRHNVVVSCITHLLSLCRPFAVLSKISEIIIYPINAVLVRWWLTHVSKEFREVTPIIAHCNASPAIEWIGRKVGVIAPVVHSHPYPVHSCSAHAVLYSCASTGYDIVTMKRVDMNNSVCPAFTNTQPYVPVMVFVNRSDCGEFSEGVTSNIFGSSGKWYKIAICHLILLTNRLIRQLDVSASSLLIVPHDGISK